MLTLTFLLASCLKDTDAKRANIINLEMLKALQGARAPQCSEIKADFQSGGKVEGQTCPENKAVVNGWSIKCVQNCDNAERLREINAEAKQFCANWCDGKGCSYTYSALSQCSKSYCWDTNYCRNNCNGPLRDQCYFQQGPSDYNCECNNPPPPRQQVPVES